MANAPRTRNPFTSSANGGRALSALQLPFFLLRPPRHYGVLTTRGRVTGKRRRRCVRIVRDGDVAYIVAIKGGPRTGWVKNALAAPVVELRIGGGRVSGPARALAEAERAQARAAYTGALGRFDYLTYANWRTGRPTPERIADLVGEWFDEGLPIVVELTGR